MSPSRSILLVGEGNFSFSSSVCKLDSESGSNITATCLQRQEEALRHDGAAANIQTIEDSGGSVLFEVDCTKLGECAFLKGRVFDRVVFNFPHCGRKSGVKKNRELLKNFFLSCVEVLAEDGEVHVSLCNGQGGTPADQPKREWHNSWQVSAMAAEAHLILSAVRHFESDNLPSYKSTGYRSQDKGFHVGKALLHVFSRSAPFTPVQIVQMEEVVEGEMVHYNIPAELSDYVSRGFLSSDSIHPVKLVQDFLLEGLGVHWPVSMKRDPFPHLISAKQLQTCCHDLDNLQYYWIHLLQKELTSQAQEDDAVFSNIKATSPPTKADRVRSKGTESLQPVCCHDFNLEVEGGLYLLRPSLLPQLEELLINKDISGNAEPQEEIDQSSEVEGSEAEEACDRCNGSSSLLFGISGVVFRSVPISLWALPAFHEILLTGVFPLENEPVKLIGHELEALLSPYGVSIVTEEKSLHLVAQPMGLIGKVFASNTADGNNHVTVSASLNLDLLAVLLFSLPDWRLLWSHDPRFLKQFSLRPPPGTPFQPFSLYPESFSFDISFWTGPAWEEKMFHAIAREASCGTVEQVKLIDTFSHPDLSQTSYCYRLTYHSHTHALSHTQALTFHKELEVLLSSRMQVTVR
ncbi:ferredoxin-fold anticodon-binding domain-containing protein 1 isoform X1 [Xiphophorus hellerii]|uniref:ferredoxin-fold anticodon-binding domain-containing protein 1 isoform X1 n=1 Tax=Xiphophorus hellerii TaxID=8084 RepID=UPI0013B3E28E|nr:ferredoxin-fold anticodon-binding domain-containing protein 1 isoform X1 [Xiphophorus hellerii]